jgi:alpha-tubulin suppressor-like RCC1 family protein
MDMTAMRTIQSMTQFCDRWFSMGMVLLALFGGVQKSFAGNHVVAWGAGTTNNPNKNYNEWGQSIVPADLTNAVLVAGGWAQSLALKADGTLEGWGGDFDRQIDFPTTSNYVAIACGYDHSIALRSDGTVVASFGADDYGQTDVPTNLNNVVSIACGFYHSLALKTDGTLVAWGGQGSVNYGQGTATNLPADITNVVAIAAGGYHNLVLKSDGTLFAWGDGDFGDTNIPVGLSNVVAIAAGASHNLALKADGTVVAWGLDNYGQTNVPANLSSVVAIAAGGWHSLALKSNGTVVAWGAGIGSDTNVDFGQNVVPANLTNGTQTAIQIAAGTVHSLALVGTNPPVTQVALFQPNFGTNGFSVSLPTQNGRVYQLQYKNSLADQNWQSLPLRAGNGGILQLTDPASVPQRFYRVEQW